MEGFNHPGFGKIRGFESVLAIGLTACFILFALQTSAVAEETLAPGLPGKNVNIVGPTPFASHVPDILLRQQNEPSCTVRPGSPAYITCAYNDYRATDFPEIQGDSWIGVSMSADFGKTWFSRLAPGFRSSPTSLNLQFAADPSFVSVPGDNSPGIAILNYIAASRDLDDGVMAVQRWAVMPQEDVNYYLPENRIFSADFTNSGRFADKPTMIAMLDPVNRRTTQTITMTLENGEEVERKVPSGTLVLCYAIFTGSNSSKITCKTSRDWGENWSKDIKLSEEQVRVQGISLTNIGDTLVAAWRRADSNKGIGNSIVTSVSVNGGKTWSKGLEATDLCPIDQLATSSQIRMLDFPVIANDGELFYVFAADRRFAGDKSCASGIPKIAMSYSKDGLEWSDLEALDADRPNPFGEHSGRGFQFIPSAVGYRGNVRVSFYDTRREVLTEPLPPIKGSSPLTEPRQMQDYLTPDNSIVNRKADVYTVQIRRDTDDIPRVSPAIRVSQYNTALFGANGAPLDPPVETEAHFPNTPIFEKGTRAFNGDYTATTALEFRMVPDGKEWIQNSLTTGNELTDREDVFVAWGDTRDLRGNYLPKFDGAASPFTPNNDAQETPFEVVGELERRSASEANTMLAAGNSSQELDNTDPVKKSTMTAESVGDTAVSLGTGNCVIGQDRTRDANVYGSMVRSVSELVALTSTKPLTGFQRTYPFVLTNPDELTTRTFILRIVDQPADFGPLGTPVPFTGQASWTQLPSKPPFTDGSAVTEIEVEVPPKSSAARTLFLVTNDSSAAITVKMYAAGCVPETDNCPALKTVVVGEGNLLDSAFCQTEPPELRPPGCTPVNSSETHDPVLLTPDLVSPDLVSARLLSPDLVSPDLVSPDLVSPDLVSPDLVSPDLVSPDLVSPDLVSPDLVSPDLVSPDLVSPDLVSPDLVSVNEPAYQDITYTVKAGGNVTTTYSTDMSFDAQGYNVTAQLIVWTAYQVATSRGCEYALETDNQILASKTLSKTELQSISLPTVDDPFAGPLSFAARPGQYINVTLRVYGALTDIQALQSSFAESTGFGASAHSCNDLDPPADPTDPTNDPTTSLDQEDDCLDLLAEKIFVDRLPPTFNLDPDTTIYVEANRADGGILNPASGDVTATDNGEAVGVMCTELSTNTMLTGAEVFPLGTYDIRCDAGDAAGNLASIELVAEIEDTVPPVVVLLGEPVVTVEAGDLYDDAGATASDTRELIEVDLTAQITVEITRLNSDGISSPVPAVDTFTTGTYELSYTAVDGGGNADATTRTVIVEDTTAPVLNLPDDFIDVSANVLGGASVEWIATANDLIDGDLDVVCLDLDTNSVITSPHVFGTGLSTVSCSATDSSGNPSSGQFTVTVVDLTAPTFTGVKDIETEATGPDGATVSWNVTAFDIVDGDLDVTCKDVSSDVNITSPHVFDIGLTTVSCSAIDLSGNKSNGQFEVSVVDTTAPEFTSVPVSVLVPVGISGTGSLNFEEQVTVKDVVDPDPVVSCKVTSGAAIGAVSGDPLPIGDYEVTCTATDASGNASDPDATYTIEVRYGPSFGPIFAKNSAKAGSTIPIVFGWLDSEGGTPVDSSDAAPLVKAQTCDSNQVVLEPGEFPGNSDLRYDSSTNEWKFNWQTVYGTSAGELEGTPIPEGWYCVQVISQRTLQTIDAPDERILIRD